MEQISNDEKNRIIDFIKYNELDYTIIDTDLFKFKIIAFDKTVFFFYKNDEEYIIVKYNPDKDLDNNPGSHAYQYFNFTTILQILEQIKFYDDSIEKNYWTPTTNSIEIGFNKDTYKNNWFANIDRDVEYSKIEKTDDYEYFTYDNPNYSPTLKSPFNTLSEESPLNNEEDQYIQVNKLYFEVHPISLEDGNETYLLRLLSNNEEVLKEFINYIVTKEKGLLMLMDHLFNSIKKCNINETFKKI